MLSHEVQCITMKMSIPGTEPEVWVKRRPIEVSQLSAEVITVKTADYHAWLKHNPHLLSQFGVAGSILSKVKQSHHN